MAGASRFRGAPALLLYIFKEIEKITKKHLKKSVYLVNLFVIEEI